MNATHFPAIGTGFRQEEPVEQDAAYPLSNSGIAIPNSSNGSIALLIAPLLGGGQALEEQGLEGQGLTHFQPSQPFFSDNELAGAQSLLAKLSGYAGRSSGLVSYEVEANEGNEVRQSRTVILRMPDGRSIRVEGEGAERTALLLKKLYESSSLFREKIKENMAFNNSDSYDIYMVDLGESSGVLGLTNLSVGGQAINASSERLKKSDFLLLNVLVHELGHGVQKNTKPKLSATAFDPDALTVSSESVAASDALLEEQFYNHGRAHSAMIAGILYQVSRVFPLSAGLGGIDDSVMLDENDPSIDVAIFSDPAVSDHEEIHKVYGSQYKSYKAAILSGDYLQAESILLSIDEDMAYNLSGMGQPGMIAEESVLVRDLFSQELIFETMNLTLSADPELLVQHDQNVAALSGFADYLSSENPVLSAQFQRSFIYFGFENGLIPLTEAKKMTVGNHRSLYTRV